MRRDISGAINEKMSLADANPEVAAEWHPKKNNLQADEVLPNSNKKAWWQGKCWHEWEATINSRNNGNGCPICAEELRSKKRSDYSLRRNGSLLDENPYYLAEWC